MFWWKTVTVTLARTPSTAIAVSFPHRWGRLRKEETALPPSFLIPNSSRCPSATFLFFLAFLSLIVPESPVNHGDDDDEYRKPQGVFFQVDHVVAQDDFQGCGREFTDEAAQGVLAEVHAGEGGYGGDEAVGHVGDGPSGGDGLPGVVGVQFFQGLTFVDNVHGHAPEEGTHDVEGNDDPHGFREPGDNDAPEEAEYESIGGGNEYGGQKAYDIDDHVDEEAHEGGVNAEGLEVVDGAPEVSIFG